MRVIILIILMGCATFSYGQTGCPDCIIDLPTLPEDTIYLSQAASGVVGEYYDGDLSFRMPKTTTPVPDTQDGLDISEITIQSVVNIPPGLTWEANQLIFDPDDETDGCVKFCGVPLVADTFEIGVIVEAQVSVISQTATFNFQMIIEPPSSNNDGFSADVTSSCGEVTVNFTNNVPSNGDDGFTYFWDFGNGNSTVAENPTPQTYSEPGTYVVEYGATLDTVGFLLTSIDILEVDCDDLIGDADIFIRIKDPQNNTVFSTSPISDTPIPVNIPVNLNMEQTGTYRLEVRDDDPFATASCGDVLFNRNDNGILVGSDGLEVQFNILNPVFDIMSTDTIVVLETPDQPQVTQSEANPICTGTIVDLTTDYTENVQWFQDTSLVFGATNPIFSTNQPGIYWVQYTASNGCQVISEPLELIYVASPAIPIHSNDDNLLSVNNEDNLPENYSAQWLLNGSPIPFADDIFWCMEETGSYTLRITDEDTGCTSNYNFSYEYDPTVDCNLTADNEHLKDHNYRIYPNPTDGMLFLEWENSTENILIQVFDVQGKSMWSGQPQSNSIDLYNLSPGLYFIQIQKEEDVFVERVMVK